MKKPSNNKWEEKRSQIIGFGESSIRKSYYPELQSKLFEFERFRVLLDKISDAIFLLKFPEAEITESNQSASSLLKVNNGRIIGNPIYSFLKDDVSRGLRAWINNISLDDKSSTYSITTELICSDQSFLPVEINFDFRDFEGKLFGIAVVRDNSERKRVEAELWNAAELQRAVIDNAGHAIITTTTSGIIQIFNKGAQKLLNYAPEEIVNRETPLLFHDINEISRRAGTFSLTLRKIIEPGFDVLIAQSEISSPNEFEWTYISKNGSRFPVLVKISALYNLEGKISGYIGTAYDLSKIKDAENELREIASEISPKTGSELFNSIAKFLYYKSMVDIILIGELAGDKIDTLVYYDNGQILRNFSYNLEDTPCKEVLDTGQLKIFPDLQKSFSNNLAIKKRKITTYIGIPLFDNSFNVTGILAIFNRKPFINLETLQSILQIFASRTGAEVQRSKTNRELIEARDNAERADKLKSEFLAQMSHEIRTPVNTILSFSSLVKSDLEKFQTEDSNTSFEIISKSGRRLIRTIDLILNMAQIQTGTFETNKTKFDLLNDVLIQQCSELTNEAKAKNIELSVTTETDDTVIIADLYSTEQIFNNLIDNAIKYTNEGSITIIIDREKTNNLVVIVKDTGIGISEEYLPTLFDPFTQEEQGYSRKFEGNGLGLALVKKYCLLNNAEISVESIKGEGTKFKVEFTQ